MKLQVAFELSGNITKAWNDVTPSAWSKMLPKGWVDNGYHLYKRMRERGDHDGIQTPSDLETAIRCGTVRRAQTNQHPNRHIIVFTWLLKNSENRRLKHPALVYDFDPKKERCEVVTYTWIPVQT